LLLKCAQIDAMRSPAEAAAPANARDKGGERENYAFHTRRASSITGRPRFGGWSIVLLLAQLSFVPSMQIFLP
jgi:hypothetical protein